MVFYSAPYKDVLQIFWTEQLTLHLLKDLIASSKLPQDSLSSYYRKFVKNVSMVYINMPHTTKYLAKKIWSQWTCKKKCEIVWKSVKKCEIATCLCITKMLRHPVSGQHTCGGESHLLMKVNLERFLFQYPFFFKSPAPCPRPLPNSTSQLQ